MRELVVQVMEGRKNTQVAQTKLLKGRRQAGKARPAAPEEGGGWAGYPRAGTPAEHLPLQAHSASQKPSWPPSSGSDGGEPGAAAAQGAGSQGGAEAAL